MTLKLRERLFVTYYLGKAEGNGTLAATMAGYGSAHVTASRLLKRAKILQAIELRLDKAAMDSEEVLARLTELGRTDASDFLVIDDSGPPRLDLQKAKRRGKMGGIKKIKTRRVDRGNNLDPLEVVEIEFHDPHKALGLLAKYHHLAGDAFAGEDLTEKTEAELESIARGKGGR